MKQILVDSLGIFLNFIIDLMTILKALGFQNPFFFALHGEVINGISFDSLNVAS